MVTLPKLQLVQLKTQLRILFVMLCGSMLFDMLDPALVIASVEGSMFYKVAALTHHREAVAFTFLLCGVATLPYMAMHIRGRRCRYHREITKAAMAGLTVSGILWAFLCFVSWRAETGWITFVFLRQIIGSLMFAGILGLMLNNELKREKELEERRQVADRSVLKLLQSAIQITPHEGQDDSYALQSYSRRVE